MALRARLAAWIDATFWPGLDVPKQPCLSAREVEANLDRATAFLAQTPPDVVARMAPPDTPGGLVYLPTSGLWPDRRALEAIFPEDAARRRARSLRASLC